MEMQIRCLQRWHDCIDELQPGFWGLSVPASPFLLFPAQCAHCLHTRRSHQRLQRKELHTETQTHNLDTKGPTPQRCCDKMMPSENITVCFMKIYLRKFRFIQVQTETAVNLIGGVRVEGREEEAGRKDDAVKENYWNFPSQWDALSEHFHLYIKSHNLFQAEK